MREAYDLLARGRLPVAMLITHRRPLAELPEVFQALDRGEAIKVALYPEGTVPAGSGQGSSSQTLA